MSTAYKLKFEKPAVIELELKIGDNVYESEIDLLLAYEEIVQADKEPTEKHKWDRINRFIATELSIPDVNLLKRNTAFEFREAIIRHGIDVMDTVKKKLEPTVS